MKMRILGARAGAVGYFGGRLVEAGADVTFPRMSRSSCERSAPDLKPFSAAGRRLVPSAAAR